VIGGHGDRLWRGYDRAHSMVNRLEETSRHTKALLGLVEEVVRLPKVPDFLQLYPLYPSFPRDPSGFEVDSSSRCSGDVWAKCFSLE